MSARLIKVAPWEDFVLRIIAIYKLAKMVLFLAIGIGLLRLMHHDVAEVLRVYVIDPMHFDSENRLLKWTLDRASELTAHKIAFISFGAFFYATVFGAEGFGLYFRKHWAEYMVLVSTGSLLFPEVYETYVQIAWWKLVVVISNLAIVFYLLHRIRLDSRNAARARDENGSSGSKGPSGKSKLPDPMVSEVP